MSHSTPYQPTGLDLFLAEFFDDRDHGRVFPASHYVRRFPELEQQIHEEFAAFERLSPTSCDVDPSAPRAHVAAPQPETIGHYEVIRALGSGGQGVVYLARDTVLHRFVALKVLRWRSLQSDDVFKRFQREGELASCLDHPGICTVYDVGVDDGRPFIAMRYVEGTTLASRIRDAREAGLASTFVDVHPSTPRRATPSAVPEPPRSALPTRTEIAQTLEMIEQCARALQAAHEAAVIHRDVKPGNIIVTPQGQPVIVDFGLARSLSAEASSLSEGCLLGTFHYMSPEQLAKSGPPVDHRTDVWSLGVTLYEALTLHRPFEGQTDEALFDEIRAREPADPRRLNPVISHDLRTVIETALQKDRERRYRSAAAFAEDLRRVRVHEPILARPITPAVRAARWARRNPLTATLASLVFVLLVIALGTTLAMLRSQELAFRKQKALLFRLQSDSEVAHDPARALHLALESARMGHDVFATEAIYRALDSLHEIATLEDVAVAAWDADGETIAVANPRGIVRVLGFDGIVRRTIETGVVDPSKLAVDGRTKRLVIFAMGRTANAALWDLESATLIKRLEHAELVTDVVVRPKDGLILTSTGHGIGLWSAADGRQIKTTVITRESSLRQVLFAGSDTQVGVVLARGGVEIWNPVDGTRTTILVPEGSRPDFDGAIGMIQGPDRLVVRRNGNNVTVYDPSTWEVVPPPTGSVDIQADRVATHSRDGRFTLSLNGSRPVVTGPPPAVTRTELLGHVDLVDGAAFSARGDVLATSSSKDHTVRLWSLVGRPDQTPPDPVTAHRLCPDLDPRGGARVTVHDGRPVDSPVDTPAWFKRRAREIDARSTHPLGTLFESGNAVHGPKEGLVGYFDGEQHVVVDDIRSGTRLASANVEHPDVPFLTFSDDATAVGFDAPPHGKRVLHLDTGQVVQLLDPRAQRFFVAVGPRGRHAATLALPQHRGSALLHDGHTGALLAELVPRSAAPAVDAVFTPDGAAILVLCGDGAAELFSTRPPYQSLRSYLGHARTATAAAFTSDGRILVTVGEDMTLRLWMAETGAVVGSIRLDSAARPIRVAIAPDDARAFVLDASGRVRSWPLDAVSAATKALPRALRPDERQQFGLEE